jgi:hypothetical protein
VASAAKKSTNTEATERLRVLRVDAFKAQRPPRTSFGSGLEAALGLVLSRLQGTHQLLAASLTVALNLSPGCARAGGQVKQIDTLLAP